MTEPKRLSDEELADAVGGQTNTNGKKKMPYCPDCATTLAFYCNVDEIKMKLYCPVCKVVFLYDGSTLTKTGEKVSF